ncbi:MAG: Lrp/AsnC family transcriptional regulator [Pseudomonadota bacterium]
MGHDTMDLKILRVLQSDADLPLDAIGDLVGLSRNACWRRIKSMTESGVIKGKTVLLDAEALGLPLTVFIQVRTDQHDQDWAQTFARATRALPQITGVYRMSGDLDYLIRAQVADMRDYDRLYQRLTRNVAIADVSASFVMEAIKDSSALPL